MFAFVEDIVSPGLPWITKGSPKLVVGLTGSSSLDSALRSYSETGCFPHYTIDLDNCTAVQHTSTDRACTMFPPSVPQAPQRHSESYWVHITRNAGDVLSKDETVAVWDVLNKLSIELKVGFELLAAPGSTRLCAAATLPFSQWLTYSGVLTSSLVPNGVWASPFVLQRPEWLDMPPAATAERPSLPPLVDEEDFLEDWPVFKGRALTLGSQSAKVPLVRKALDMADGDFDEDLEGILREIQRANLLEPTGMLDAETWRIIGDSR